MENNRDDFSSVIKDVLAKRVGYLCSNCRQPTVGANEVPNKATSIGIAAHITAAAPDGPRFNADLQAEERRDIGNGIWLCGNCSKLGFQILQGILVLLMRLLLYGHFLLNHYTSHQIPCFVMVQCY